MTICVQYEETHFDISCRVNVDEMPDSRSALQYLWAHISTFACATEHFLSNITPGLFYRVSCVKVVRYIRYNNALYFYYGNNNNNNV